MKQVNKKGSKNLIGAIGEEIAKKYLKSKGFEIVSENYLKKWGEIDIVARETVDNTKIINFFEVKTVSYETKGALKLAVSHGTYRPEEQVHQKKLERMNRTIESWLVEHKWKGEWEIDIIAVRIVPREKYSLVKHIENVFL